MQTIKFYLLLFFILLLPKTASSQGQLIPGSQYYFDTEGGFVNFGALKLRVDPEKDAELISNNCVKIPFQAVNYFNTPWNINDIDGNILHTIPRNSTDFLAFGSNIKMNYSIIFDKAYYNHDFYVTLCDNDINNPELYVNVPEISIAEIVFKPILSAMCDYIVSEALSDIHITELFRLTFSDEMFNYLKSQDLVKNLVPFKDAFEIADEIMKIVPASKVSEILNDAILNEPNYTNFNIDFVEIIDNVTAVGFSKLCLKISGGKAIICDALTNSTNVILDLSTQIYDQIELGGINANFKLKRNLYCENPINDEISKLGSELIIDPSEIYNRIGNLHDVNDRDYFLFRVNEGMYDAQLKINAINSMVDVKVNFHEILYKNGIGIEVLEVIDYKTSDFINYKESEATFNFRVFGTSQFNIKRVYAISLERADKSLCNTSDYYLEAKFNPINYPVMFSADQSLNEDLTKIKDVPKVTTRSVNSNSNYFCENLVINGINVSNDNSSTKVQINLQGIRDEVSYSAILFTENGLEDIYSSPITPLPFWDNKYNIEFNNLQCGKKYKYEIRKIFGDELCKFTGYINISDNCELVTNCRDLSITNTSPVNNSSFKIGEPYTLSWNIGNTDQSCFQNYEFAVSRDGSFLDYNPVVTTKNTITQTGNSEYEFYWRVRAKNTDGNYGPWSTAKKIVIQGNATQECIDPDGLAVGLINSTEATVRWMNVNPDEEYELQYGRSTLGYINTEIVSGFDYKQLRYLNSDETYVWRIRSICGSSKSNWVYGPKFTTFRANQIDADGDFSIRIFNVSSTRNLCKGQELDFTADVKYFGQSISILDVEFGVFFSEDDKYDSDDILLHNERVSFPISGSIGGGSSTERFSRTIQLPYDINQDIDDSNPQRNILLVADYNNRFLETNEFNNIYASGIDFFCRGCCDPDAHNYNPGVTNIYYSSNQVPNCIKYGCETCQDGVQNGDETGIDCGGIKCGPCDQCEISTELTTSSITTNSAILTWLNGDSNVNSFTVLYKAEGETEFREIYTTSNRIILRNLSLNTKYCWKIRSNCSDIQVESSTKCFTTALSDVNFSFDGLSIYYKPESTCNEPNVYYWEIDGQFDDPYCWPGDTMQFMQNGWYHYILDADCASFNFNCSGQNQTSDLIDICQRGCFDEMTNSWVTCPTFKPVVNIFPKDRNIESGLEFIKILSDNATEIYYTLDGSIPNKNSIPYTNSFQIVGTENDEIVIKAIAFNGLEYSEIVEATFTFHKGIPVYWKPPANCFCPSIYYWNLGGAQNTPADWPGIKMQPSEEAGWYKGIIPDISGNFIFSCNGSNQTIDYTGVAQTRCIDGFTNVPCPGTFLTCEVPNNLVAEVISKTGISLSWDAVQSTADYTVEYKKSSSTIWNSFNASSNSYFLGILLENTQYDFRVRANCSYGGSEFSSTISAKTLSSESCQGRDWVTPTSAIITSDTYKYSNTISSTGKIESGSDVTFQAGTSITLKPGFHAKAGSNFHAFIGGCIIAQTIVDDTVHIQAFQKPVHEVEIDTNKVRHIESQDEKSLQIVESEAFLKIVPNPTAYESDIFFSLPKAGKAELGVYDLNGRLLTGLQARHYTAQQHKVTLDVTQLPAGVYFVRLQGKDFSKTERMVIIR